MSPKTHEAQAKYVLYFSMHIMGIKNAIHEIVSKISDLKTPLMIAHNLLLLVKSNHNAMLIITITRRMQLAIEIHEMFSIPYSITASSLNQRQSSKVTATRTSFL